MQVNSRRLYRCREDRKLAGVAAGMAEYLEMDPTVIRVAWILSAFLGGFTILLYIILAFIVPPEPIVVQVQGEGTPGDAEATAGTAGTIGVTHWTPGSAAPHGHDVRPADDRPGRAGTIFGVLLVVFGGIALIDEVIPNLAVDGILGPAFVLALGVALLVSSARRPAAST
jgi:phage shock protein PspC (stress-responsive transcriptional regulator)